MDDHLNSVLAGDVMGEEVAGGPLGSVLHGCCQTSCYW